MLKWTTNPPDQPGWYFRKEVVHKANNRRAVAIVPIFFEEVREIGVTDNANVTLYWAGPIPEPEDPDA